MSKAADLPPVFVELSEEHQREDAPSGETYVGVGQLQESINELFAALAGAARKM